MIYVFLYLMPLESLIYFGWPGLEQCSRGAASLLIKGMGSDVTVARNLRDYSEIAVRIAELAKHRRQSLRHSAEKKNASKLFDTGLWVQHIERAALLLWESHQVFSSLHITQTPHGMQEQRRTHLVVNS